MRLSEEVGRRRCQIPRRQRAPRQAVRPRADRPPRRRGVVRRGRHVRQRQGRGPARRWRGDRHGHDRRPARVPDGQRLHREGRVVGARTVEKIIRIIEVAYKTGVPMVYLVDSRRGPDHRPGRLVPRPPRRGQDLSHPGQGQRGDPAGVRAVRTFCCRRRLHPGLLRHRDHGRGQRQHVPGQRPHGADGHRREDHAGGDGRGPGALRGQRGRAHARQE